jgi:CheY-like chemotaxis protein
MIKLHVLFADANPAVRGLIVAALERDPFFVGRGCASGGAVIKTALEWRPDLVLLDAELPGLDDTGVLARLRADRRTAAMPVVLMTARASARERARLAASGAAGLIEKPFEPASLAGALRRFVPVEGLLAPARRDFLRRLNADARALAACRVSLSRRAGKAGRAALLRIGEIAHGLAGAGGTYGFAGITSESALLSDVARNGLAGRAGPREVEQALDRLLNRIKPR